MKIIEALKAIKQYDRKIEKALKRIADWCSYELDEANPEQPLYNADDISRMKQQTTDWTMEKARLRHLLHRTNIRTEVEFEGKTYNIDQLLLLNEVIIPARIATLKLLTRRSLSRRSFISDVADKKIKIVMQYDPKEREKEIDFLENTSTNISALLDTLTLNTELSE